MGRIVFWLLVAVATLFAATGLVPAAYVFAPLLGWIILWVGLGFLRSLDSGGPHPAGASPEIVNQNSERTTYSCGTCGAELLLIVRGTESTPRHCGEPMHERREVIRD